MMVLARPQGEEHGTLDSSEGIETSNQIFGGKTNDMHKEENSMHESMRTISEYGAASDFVEETWDLRAKFCSNQISVLIKTTAGPMC